jgi:hypothetical protein
MALYAIGITFSQISDYYLLLAGILEVLHLELRFQQNRKNLKEKSSPISQ